MQAGAIDLKVDNTCYYNGRLCRLQPDGTGIWEGTEEEECTCSWTETDLTTEKFFELLDIKPGDWEEDTISLRVKDNEAWLCADVHLTSDDDVTCTEPESESTDPQCNLSGVPGKGELADRVNFLWWADDGDNVLECRLVDDDENPQTPEVCDPLAEGSEHTLPSGPLGVLDVSQTAHVTLADASNNMWTGLPNNPIPQGGDTWYIGKGWCFGRITETPVPQDGLGSNGQNGPNSPRGGGFSCDGSDEGNETQTDRLNADIGFRAVQARNNPDFLCNPPIPE